MPKEEKLTAKERRRQRKYVQFSKILAGSFALSMTPVSVYVIYRCLALAELAITRDYTGALPYLTAVVGFVEAAVTIVLGFYFNNSKAEKVANAQYGFRSAQQDDPLNRDF